MANVQNIEIFWNVFKTKMFSLAARRDSPEDDVQSVEREGFLDFRGLRPAPSAQDDVRLRSASEVRAAVRKIYSFEKER